MSVLVLKYATSQAFDASGLPYSYTYAKVKVMNLAEEKLVTMHYQSAAGTWLDTSLQWIANYGDYDIFAYSCPFTSAFVVRYVVNGATYWDNNNGSNYLLENFTSVVGRNITLSTAQSKIGHEAGGGFEFTTSWMEGEIYVNNISYNKRVGIRLSTDGGTTWSETLANYSGPATEETYTASSGVEIWTYSTPVLNLDSRYASFLFAAFYIDLDSGQQFWDNNFSRNYLLSKNDGSTLQ